MKILHNPTAYGYPLPTFWHLVLQMYLQPHILQMKIFIYNSLQKMELSYK